MNWLTSFALLSMLAIPLSAQAEDAPPAVRHDAEVSVVRSQFTDKIESSKPVGDASTLAPGKVATYWVEVNNPNDASTQVTLVWKLDGKEIVRQSLDVGHSPTWRTWGMCNVRSAHAVEVEVLDKDGRSLHTDTASIGETK